MSDRGFLFLFSCTVILGSLAAAGWLAASGQAATVDGLFLLLVCLTIAAAFGLYVMFLIKRAMESAAPVQAAAKASAAPEAAAKPKAAPLVAAEKAD